MQRIYLDHNATTTLAAEAAHAMAACYAADYGNPASQHADGRRARRLVEDAREAIATMLGADLQTAQPDQVLFTSGGTESNNFAVLGLGRSQQPAGTPSGGDHWIVSAIEHPCVLGAGVLGPAEWLGRSAESQDSANSLGPVVDRLPVNADGVVDIAAIRGLIRPTTRLASVMLANHETGVLQPIAELAAICQAAGVPLHTDAAQVAGKLPIDFQGLGVTAMTISAHKFGGPPGIGALLLRAGQKIRPLLHGGFQQSGLRPGTEPLALVLGMRAALAAWCAEQAERAQRLQAMRDRFEAELSTALPDLVIAGRSAPRLPHVSNVAFVGLNRQALLMALDLAGVSCSTGSACASGSSDPSPTLAAMGCSREVLDSALRFSWGISNQAHEVDLAVRRILTVYKDLRKTGTR